MCVKSDNKHTNKQSGHFGNKPRKFTKLRINKKKNADDSKDLNDFQEIRYKIESMILVSQTGNFNFFSC